MAKAFASQGDLAEKEVRFEELADGVYGYTAEGDPNAGVIIGDEEVMVLEALATPVMAQSLIGEIRKVTDKPIRYLLLSHYHAVRVMGASAFAGASVITSRDTRDLIAERGQQDFDSEVARFPRLFRAVETVPGLTWPHIVFEGELDIWLGDRKVELRQVGRAHTKGDTIAWLPGERIMFSGDIVEYASALYCGDAYLRDWPGTLEAIRAYAPEKLVPGRGAALRSRAQVEAALDGTGRFVSALYGSAKEGVAAGRSLKEVYDATYAAMAPEFGDWVIFDHCMPFNVSRAFDEAGGIGDPRIWTAERDREMWAALEG